MHRDHNCEPLVPCDHLRHGRSHLRACDLQAARLGQGQEVQGQGPERPMQGKTNANAPVQGSMQALHAADASTDAAISSSSSTEPLLFLGRRVEKLFDGESFPGVVDSYDEKTKWFHVKYDDDDTEEYTRKELEPLLLELPASEPSEDVQAESDDDAPLSTLMGKQIAPLDQQSPLALPLPVSE